MWKADSICEQWQGWEGTLWEELKIAQTKAVGWHTDKWYKNECTEMVKLGFNLGLLNFKSHKSITRHGTNSFISWLPGFHGITKPHLCFSSLGRALVMLIPFSTVPYVHSWGFESFCILFLGKLTSVPLIIIYTQTNCKYIIPSKI